ncbi:phage holin family protein [Mucilaginibacter achroorhodeus]|uniref:Phage holin family protein n=1 Tax=Mucilaginibacter achroorhodeus TaxID=2599294 RepID=A0A563U6F0_9SPHI|nr:phage holin family protein [Mucilaginibacter achroorhodeus]TWR26894.1 phage holin family protein [Mucilaginibacter achroorhodeus]
MDFILHLFKKIFSYGWKLQLAFLLYLTPIQGYLLCVYILLFIDLISGVYKALIAKQKITSKRLRDTIVKYFFYSLAIYIGFEIDLKILQTETDFYLSRLIGGTIAMIEAYSILENISVITGTNILETIKNKLADYINSKIKLPDVNPNDKAE